MLEIQTKQLPPDIVVLEITGRISIGRECKQLEWAVDSLVREKQQKKIIFDPVSYTHLDVYKRQAYPMGRSAVTSVPRPLE